MCTLGPASHSPEGLRALIDAGMDVARLNFSHGSHEDHGGALARLRAASDDRKKSVAALQDLCGPKIRTGKFPKKFDLPSGVEAFLVEGEASEDERVIPINYEGLAGDVRVGDHVLFDDGRLVLRVLGVEGERVKVRVEQGGGMRDHVGVHLPSKTMRISALTEKDKSDLSFGLSSGVDYIAMSFVRRAEDLHTIREILPGVGRAERRSSRRSRRRTPWRTWSPSWRRATASWSRAGTSGWSSRRSGCPSSSGRSWRWRGESGGRSSSRPRCCSR